MNKRLTFTCWKPKCRKKYTLFREITGEQELIVACPYCLTEGVVDLAPYRKPGRIVLRGVAASATASDFEIILPDVVPTREAQG